MAFVVQTDAGDGVDANAYITVEFFTAYHTERNVEAVVNSLYSETQVQAGIILATDYIDNRWRYRGAKLLDDQTTEFPRENLYDRDGLEVAGIPTKLKRAAAEYALRAITAALAPDPVTDETGARVIAKSQEVGPIKESFQYADASAATYKPYPAADAYLRGYVVNGKSVIR